MRRARRQRTRAPACLACCTAHCPRGNHVRSTTRQRQRQGRRGGRGGVCTRMRTPHSLETRTQVGERRTRMRTPQSCCTDTRECLTRACTTSARRRGWGRGTSTRPTSRGCPRCRCRRCDWRRGTAGPTSSAACRRRARGCGARGSGPAPPTAGAASPPSAACPLHARVRRCVYRCSDTWWARSERGGRARAHRRSGRSGTARRAARTAPQRAPRRRSRS